MPHFITHCSATIENQASLPKILKVIHEAAEASALFKQSIIKVRIIPFKHALVNGEQQDFIHIIGHIMEGRTIEQRSALADRIVRALKLLLPQVSTISIEIIEINKTTYSNRDLV